MRLFAVMCALSAQQALRADALGVGSRAIALERASIMTGSATANIVAQFSRAASKHMRECVQHARCASSWTAIQSSPRRQAAPVPRPRAVLPRSLLVPMPCFRSTTSARSTIAGVAWIRIGL